MGRHSISKEAIMEKIYDVNRAMKYRGLSSDELLEQAIFNWTRPEILEKLEYECTFRRSRSAKRVMRQIKARLKVLSIET